MCLKDMERSKLQGYFYNFTLFLFDDFSNSLPFFGEYNL